MVSKKYRTNFLNKLRKWYFDNIENAFQYSVDLDSIEFKMRIFRLVINHLQNNKQFYINHLRPQGGKNKNRQSKDLSFFIKLEGERLKTQEYPSQNRNNLGCEKVKVVNSSDSGVQSGYYWTGEASDCEEYADGYWEL